MKTVLPKRHFPFLSLSAARRLASVLRFFLIVSRTLPLHAAAVLTPAGGLIVPRIRTRTRLPMIRAVAELPGPLNENVGVAVGPVGAARDVTNCDASPVLPALSANVTLTV